MWLFGLGVAGLVLVLLDLVVLLVGLGVMVGFVHWIRWLDVLVGLVGDVLVGRCCGWVGCGRGWLDVFQRVGGLIELGWGWVCVWAMGLLLWDV